MISIACLQSISGQIVQPAGILEVRSGKDLSDLFGNLVLMGSYIYATIGSNVENLDISCVMGHNVFECLLDAAETSVDAVCNLYSAAQWNLKNAMRLLGSQARVFVPNLIESKRGIGSR
ncbi:hypothetical protein [Mesorhizobium sp. M0816]|uniref:hypothetical protein n=1 Tax=Mesorhizobium sp. M0816 TaxID=2957006 RepID=UPI003334F6C8